MSANSSILTRRQRRILNAIAWRGDVSGAFLFTEDDRCEHSRSARDVRALTRRGYLAHNRLTRKGALDVRRREWDSGNPVLREMIREQMS